MMNKRLKVLLALTIAITLTTCGGGGGGGSSSGSGDLSSAESNLCDELSGLEAIYWDFINGVVRADLPSTAFTIPFDIQLPGYSNSTPGLGALLNFSVPVGWNVNDSVDVSGFAVPATVIGADLIRTDNQAVWRYIINAQITGGFTSASILNSEVNAALTFFGNPAIDDEQCEFNLQQPTIIGTESVAIKVVRAGDYTIMARAHVNIVNGALTSFYDAYVSVARTSENTEVINDIFVPMITQLYGGGSDPDACEDGVDNDGDGQTDFPADAQCSSPSDDSES